MSFYSVQSPLKVLLLILIAPLFWGGILQVSAQSDPYADAEELIKSYNHGMSAFDGGDWTGAIGSLEKVVSLTEGLADPAMKKEAQSKLAPVYFTLGAAAFNIPDFAKSIAAFERFEKEFPTHEKVPEARRALARAAFSSKDFAKALELFAEMEKYPSQREMSLQIQAECYREMGKTAEMEQVLTRLIEGGIITAIQSDGALQLAMVKLEAKKFDEVAVLADQLIDRRQMVKNVVMLNHIIVSLGDAQAEAEKFEEASRTYTRVMPPSQVIAFQQARIEDLERRIAANVAVAAQNPGGSLAAQTQNVELQATLEESRRLLVEFKKLPDYGPGLMLRNARCWYGREKKWESILVNERLLELYPNAEKEREAALYGCIVGYAEVLEQKKCGELSESYLKLYPKSPNAGTVAYIHGAVAMEAGDLKSVTSLFGRYLDQFAADSFNEQMHLILASAHFNLGEMDDARKIYLRYVEKFPKGASVEEAKYRAAIIPVFQGKYEEGWKAIEAFIKELPNSTFTPDAKYRLMVCKYAASLYDEIVEDTIAWRKAHPGVPMEAEVMALRGDCLAALSRNSEAAEAYVTSSKLDAPEEVMIYSLSEGSKLLYKLGDMTQLSTIWEDFIQKNPESPNVVAGIYWIGRAKTREGKIDEAKAVTVDQLKRCLNDRKNESVELLVSQLAQFCLKRPRAVNPTPAPAVEASPGSSSSAPAKGEGEPTPAPATLAPAPPPLPPWDALGEMEKLLKPLDGIADQVGKARLSFARMELLKLLKKPEEAEVLMRTISVTKPEDLSPQLLALAGDFLQLKKFDDEAAVYFNYLKENYPNSAWLDYAYCGLGNIAMTKGAPEEALKLFTLAADEYTGGKIKESTMGRGLALMETGKYDEAKKTFEMVAGTREWRGEVTAQAVYSLGELEERQGRLPEAIAHYQRVFVAYQKYIPWVEKAYLKTAECFEKLKKRPEAIAHLQEVVRHEKLGSRTKSEARKQLEEWGVKG